MPRGGADAAAPKPPRRRGIRAGDPIEALRRTRGVIGVRRLAIGVLQQQIEQMRDKWLGPADRTFLLEACRVLIGGEKVVKAPTPGAVPRGSGGDSAGSPLPPLSTGAAGK